MSDDKVQPGLPAVIHLLAGINEMVAAMPESASAVESMALNTQQATMAGIATVHALLAVETRLGELVEQQRVANVLAMLSKVSNLDLDWEAEQAAYEHLRGELAALLKSAEPGE
ncbi:hypothetical protein [Nocardia sp. CA-290969]|uniref:hypothetical protein n=1 Tax=Nocardia sp. CA-290969 TaxID=3239986 RepID=UPI003D93AAD2